MSLNKIYSLKVGNLPQLFLIHGSEEYYPLIDSATNHIKSLTPEKPICHSFNADRYFKLEAVENLLLEDDMFNPSTYIEIIFATKPVIELQKQLTELITSLKPNVTLVIITDKLATKELSGAWVDKFKQSGLVVDVSDSNAKAFMQYQLESAQIELSREAQDLLLSQNSGNYIQLLQEVNKIIYLYPANTSVGIDQIQQIDNSNYTVYQLSSAYLQGDLALSLKILDEFYLATEDAILINWMIHEDLKKLIQIKNDLQNSSFQMAISKFRIWGDAINGMKLASSRLSYSTMLSILDMCAQLDRCIKGIDQSEPKSLIIQMLRLFSN